MISSFDPNSDLFLADLSRVQANNEKVQRQISSGLRINDPSDAPDQIAGLLQIQSDISRNSQVQQNLGRVKAEVDTAEQSVSSAVQLADNALVLASQGANTATTASTRLNLAQQVQALQQQLVQLAQTKVDGRYVFSGDADQTPPYQYNAASPNGVDRLVTASATRQVQDSNGNSFPVAQTAQTLFDHRDAKDGYAPDNLFAALNALMVTLSANDEAGIGLSMASLRTAADYVNSQQTFYGVTQNRVSAAVDASGQRDVSLRAQLSKERDTDLTSAALTITDGRTQEQAALASRAKMQKTSLFDYLG